MNIFGEGFPQEIIKQIKTRQKIYGSGYEENRSPEEISYLNSNTSWCKLISGVNISSSNDINNPTISNLKLNSNELAKKFILFNGTADSNGTGQRAGISPENSILGGDSAYGIGGTDFGINPMMGIISANIKHENRGSLRRAEIKIKAFNRAQFEIIDTLYLRLGFSVLLEWGHAITINNDGSINFNPQYSLSDMFLRGDKTYDEVLQLIYEQRLNSGGNYDAMLGKVANFNWSFNRDGSYDITVYLSAIGDVIESLKINGITNSAGFFSKTNSGSNQELSFNPTKFFTPDNKKVIEKVLEDDVAEDIIDTFAYSSDIGYFLYQCKTAIETGDKLVREEGGVKALKFRSSNLNLVVTKVDKQSFPYNIFDINNEDIISVIFDDLSTKLWGDDVRFYVRLGTFLRFIEKKIVPKLYNIQNKPSRLLKFDTDINTNLMMVHPYQVSLDPRICYINRTVNVDDKSLNFGILSPANPFINEGVTSKIGKKGVEYGSIMNIYLDITFILKKITELSDDKGNIPLISFLKGLMSGLNEGLGGINDFDVFIDDTNNCVKIIDKNPLLYTDEVIAYLNDDKNVSQSVWNLYNNGKKINQINLGDRLELYGYNPASVNIPFLPKPAAGFISEFSLTSNLSPEFSTMITVGAAANATVVGENDTALSKLNRGFEDRYKHTIEINSNDNGSNTLEVNKENYEAKLKELNNIKNTYIEYLKLLQNKNDPNDRDPQVEAEAQDIDNYKSYLSSLVQKSIEVDRIKDKLNGTTTIENYQGTGFLPFNLSLTMNGLSGIKINQQFLLNTSFLPTNYPDVLKFLIKGLSHEISNNKWITKVETYAVPKPVNKDEGKKVASILFEEDNVTPSSETTTPPQKGEVDVFSKYLNPLRFSYPVTARISSGGGWRTNPTTGKPQYHNGTDFAAPVGTKIYSACDGTVIQVGAKKGFGPYAILVKVNPSCFSQNKPDNNPIFIWYGHNDSATVKVGSSIKQGQEIGTIGNQGTSTGPHLHFEIFSGPNAGVKSKIISTVGYTSPEGRKVTANTPFQDPSNSSSQVIIGPK